MWDKIRSVRFNFSLYAWNKNETNFWCSAWVTGVCNLRDVGVKHRACFNACVIHFQCKTFCGLNNFWVQVIKLYLKIADLWLYINFQFIYKKTESRKFILMTPGCVSQTCDYEKEHKVPHYLFDKAHPVPRAEICLKYFSVQWFWVFSSTSVSYLKYTII